MKVKKMLLTLALCCLVSGSAHATAKGYVRIGSLEGDAKDPVHREWFEIISFDQGPHRWTHQDNFNAFMPKENGHTGAGNMQVNRFVRYPVTGVYTACANGTFLGSVTVDVPLPSGEQNKYIRWTFHDVVINEVNLMRPGQKRGVPIEAISFSYESADWEVKRA